eukprot:gene14814-16354_t
MASSSVEDYASIPSSHNNTERGKGYEKRTKERNKINKRQLASLERNKLRPREFEEFGQNETVQKIFYEVVMEGFAKSNIMQDTSEAECSQEIDDYLVDLVVNNNILLFGFDEKRKLLTQIVTGADPVETEKEEDNPPTTSCGQSGQDHSKESENAAKRQKCDVPTNCQFSICGADLQCKRNFESTSGEFNVCTECSKWYHKQCFDMESTGPNRLNCGCSRTASTLRSKQKFRSEEGLAYLFRFWNSKIKKYFKELETGKRFSQRFNLFKNGQYRKLEKESLDYTWLVGDDLSGHLQQNLINFGMSVPFIRNLKTAQTRYGFNQFVLAFEVLAFMLHKEEGFPIAHGRRLLSHPEDGSPEN